MDQKKAKTAATRAKTDKKSLSHKAPVRDASTPSGTPSGAAKDSATRPDEPHSHASTLGAGEIGVGGGNKSTADSTTTGSMTGSSAPAPGGAPGSPQNARPSGSK